MLKYLMPETILKNIQEELKRFFENKEDILLCFLFGSVTTGHFTKNSDIDIALYFSTHPSSEKIMEIYKRLSENLPFDIDIVVLNTASPIIRMQVLKNAIPVKIDKRGYYEFYTRTIKDYDDLKFIRREQEKNIIKGRIYA